MSVTALANLDASSSYASRRRQHLQLINKLRALGAEADLDLPRIAVIGNQSAGKSSLVEAISGISVPRDAGTCTRCPIECRMANSESAWSCKISIRWEFHTDGTKRDPVEEVMFGAIIHDKEQVEPALRRAQAAVLNPGKTGFEAALLESLQSGTNQLSFSPNVVCVDLAGPHLVDLAFVDLPGIIQNAEPAVVSSVENLVVSHIRGNCVILVTLPMSDDIENQKAMSLARQVDPSGSRTIGVLTKPDTLTEGAIKAKENWLDVIENRNVKFPLKLGYYCTRQPDEDERRKGITTAEARSVETNFFANTSPWSRTTVPQRFGTSNLVMNVSTLLTGIIDKSLPSIVQETDRQLSHCHERLKALPPVTSEPVTLLLSLVTQFTNMIKVHVEGSLDAATLVQESRSAFSRLKSDIRSTAPPFLPYPNPKDGSNVANDEARRLLSLDDDENPPTPPSGYIYLDQVRARITAAITRELPNNTPYVAKLSFIQDFQQSWKRLAEQCAAAVYQSLHQLVNRLLQSIFGVYRGLEPKVRQAVDELIREKWDMTIKQLLRILKYETTAFTQNDHYLSASKEQFLATYKDARAKKKGSSRQQLLPPKVLPVLSQYQPRKPYGSPGTLTTKLEPVIEHDPTIGSTIYCVDVSCMPALAAWSREELRLTDYQNGAKPGGLFSPPQAAQSTTPFGASGFGFLQSPVKASSQPANNAAGNPVFGLGNPATPQSKSPQPFQGFQATPQATIPSASQPTLAPASQATPSPAAGFFGSLLQPAASSVLSEEERQREEATILASLARLGYQGVHISDLGRLRPDDEYLRELEVMAEVRAYFKVAYKRVIDYVPLAIDHEFLRSFADDLQTHLFRKLGLVAPDAADRCAAYLADEPSVAATREELLSRQKRLLSVKEELQRFGM